MRQKQHSKKIPCPLCRRETLLTENGVTGLPNDFKLSALVEEVTLQEKLMGGQESEVECQNCDDGNKAASRCTDCDHFLCQECQQAHGRMKLMKSHQIYTLAQLQSGEIAIKSKIREYIPKCAKHTDQNLNIYCNTCEQLKCTTCCVLDHANSKHSLVDLPEALDKLKQDVAEQVAQVITHKTELQIAMKETDKSRKKLNSVFAQTNKKISKRADKEYAKIREEEQQIRNEEQKVKKEEQKLKREAAKIHQDRAKMFETAQATNRTEVTQVQHKLDEVNRLMTQGSCYEILDLKQKLLHNLKEMTQTKPERLPDKLSFLDFEEGVMSFGRVVQIEKPKLEMDEASIRLKDIYLKHKWELKQEILEVSFAHSVAAFSNSKIVGTDIEHNQLYSFVPSGSDSPITLNFTGLSTPTQAAVNKDDHFIIIDGTEVKIFSKKFKLLHRFKPGRGFNSTPTCIAVDGNNLIAVGYEHRDEITLHNPDGSFIRKMLAPGISGYLTTCNQHLIYTNWQNYKLISVDYNGCLVFSIDLIDKHDKELWKPTGVICDNDGSIYVAVRKCLGQSVEILQYSPDGKFIGCAVKGHRHLYGITFTPDGDLVAAAGDCFQVYQHVWLQQQAKISSALK